VNSLTPQQEPETRYEPDSPVEAGGEHAYRDYEPIHPRGGLGDLLRKLWAPIAAIGLLIFKFKTAILAIFKLKIFVTSASMLVSIAAYAWIWGWRFAVGFVLLLLVHELGHVLELRRQGIPASAPLFIPFLGAVVGMKQMPHNVWKEAQVALAGPIVGSLAAFGLWAAGDVLGYIAWLFVIDAAPFGLIVAIRRRHDLAHQLRLSWPASVLGGVLALGAYGLVIWAMTLAPMASVSALRETSVVMAALIGTRLLREPFGRRRVVAAGIVALGVVLLEAGPAG